MFQIFGNLDLDIAFQKYKTKIIREYWSGKKQWSQVTSGHMREDESKPNNANSKNKLRLLCHDYFFGEQINNFKVFLYTNKKNVEIGGISWGRIATLFGLFLLQL